MAEHPNPVIAAVDAGHVNHGDRCAVCTTAWKCATMEDAEVAARERNRQTRTPLRNDRDASVYGR